MTTPKKEKRSSSARRKVTTSPVTAPLPIDTEFQTFLGLLAAYNDAHWLLGRIQKRVDRALLDAVEINRTQFATLQVQLAHVLGEIEKTARANPRWFGEGKTLPTPYGTIKLTATTRLVVEDEAAAITALEASHRDTTQPNPYLRCRVELNLEALAAWPTDMLGRLGVRRVTEDKFMLRPARADVGKIAAATGGKEGGE